ncbi:MAG: extracellular solute-binding protein [Eubacteriales bacterium]|nr:extracellular solute-binding protein [Eubacteriales bacterium]
MIKKTLGRALAFFCLAGLMSGMMPPASADSLVVMGLEDASLNRDWASNRFFARMAEKTGFAFTFRQYSDEGAYREALAAMTVSAELPDVLFKAALSPAEASSLLEKGVLADLAPHLDKHCPNLTALVEENPVIRQAITLPGGQIAALPFVETAPAQNVLWINKAWLDTLGLDIPRDNMEFMEVLKAFKSRDPNRNGRADEVPLSFLGAYDLKYLAHAFGLVGNDYNLFVDQGEVRFVPLEKEFEAFIVWCRELYQEGLLARDGFSTADALRRVTDGKATNTFGAFFSPLPSYLVPLEWGEQYAALRPLEYNGERVYRPIAQPVITGTFALTTACRDAAGALEWVDSLYTQEGAVMAAIGQEGVDYVVDGDGSWRSVPGISDAEYQANAVIATGTALPGVSSDAFQRGYTDSVIRSVSEQVDIVTDAVKTPFPPFSLSADEEAAIAPLQEAIGRYVDESIARFVLGEWEVTREQFAVFEQELQALGLEAFLSFWQGIYNRTEGLTDVGP